MKIDFAKRRRVMERSKMLGHCICDPHRLCPCDIFRERGICPCAGERPEAAHVSQVRLMDFTHNAGCASKISPADLDAVLARLPEVKDPSVISGLAAADDAAIYRLAENLCLVQTVDVFTPCVDDARLFGKICAANCLSDIYAMGGTPRTALSVLAFPSEKLPGELVFQMLSGAMEKFQEAGVALVGGHSVKDDEIKLGFAITGVIEPAVAAALEKPQAGDLLVLTKPLGTGVLTFARQIGREFSEGAIEAEMSMATLNRGAAEAMREAGASGCTDVTGFGLFAHLRRMLRGSGLGAEIFAESLPAFPGVVEALRQGVIPGAIERNREYVAEALQAEAGVDEALVNLGFDAQTSGGLLITVPAEGLEELRESLTLNGASGFVIGNIVDNAVGGVRHKSSPCDCVKNGKLLKQFPCGCPPDPTQLKLGVNETSKKTVLPPAAGQIRVRAGSAEILSTEKNFRMKNPETETAGHGAGCCADMFQNATAQSYVAETQKAFGAFMQSVQAGGALSEKQKELIMFSLVVHSRCEPCFESHCRKAREMGITQAELDEAAWCAIAMGGAPVKMFYQERRDK